LEGKLQWLCALRASVVKIPMNSALLTPKELAAEAGFSIRTMRQIVRRGFKMPGGLATLDELRDWQRRNPRPFSKHWRN